MDQGLYNRMIRCIHMGIQREVTIATAVKRSISIRSNDPILPLQVLEADVERLNLTAFLGIRIARLQ